MRILKDNIGSIFIIDKDSIWKKPVRFYIENKDCSQTAIDFYFGKYSPTSKSGDFAERDIMNGNL